MSDGETGLRGENLPIGLIVGDPPRARRSQPTGYFDNKEPALELRIAESQWGATENPMGIRTNNAHAVAAKHKENRGPAEKGRG
jgi:hypothetical protein